MNTVCCDKTGISASNVVDYGIWIIHESNAPFTVTRHQYRMMCDKDILQLSFEDLNQSMSTLKISYHYTSSVTVSSSNRHPVCASCTLPRHVLLEHLDPWRWDRLVIPKRNGITILCCAQPQKIVGLKTSILVSFQQKNARWWNIYIYICSVTLLQKMSKRVKSHELPHQGIGPALSTQHWCSSFKSFFISKNHQTWGLHLLIPHKQNPHTENNQLAVNC